MSNKVPDKPFDTVSQDRLEMVRGDDNTYFIDLEGYNKATGEYEPLDLTAITEIFMTAKETRTKTQLFQVSHTGGEITRDAPADPNSGAITIVIANTLTNLEPTEHKYDVEVQWGTIKRTPLIGVLDVIGDVTD